MSVRTPYLSGGGTDTLFVRGWVCEWVMSVRTPYLSGGGFVSGLCQGWVCTDVGTDIFVRGGFVSRGYVGNGRHICQRVGL